MKKLSTFMLVAAVMIALGLAGCKEKVESEQLSGEHPSKVGEQPSKVQPKPEHPTEHPR